MKKEFKKMPADILEKISTLTPKEEKYFRCMWPKSGVLYITSKPGVAKSAMTKSIADKMGYQYYDIRLSMRDETDVGLFPDVTILDGVKCLDFVVPRWAIEANKRPTIIHFEELNRALLPVRNAALQLLLERGIGEKFKFNDNVLMVASGNLGEEDATDVEEFDSALNGRLIHMRHVLSVEEWMDGYAIENIHPVIVSFIDAYPEYLYKESNPDSSGAYASPRSWTFLSDYLVCNYGMESDPKEFVRDLLSIAVSYVGDTSKKFVTYCQEMISLNINDIINNYDNVKEQLNTFNRDKRSELMQSLKKKEISGFSTIQIDNVTKFLKTVGEDELTDYLINIVDTPGIVIDTPMVRNFLKQFSDVLEKALTINERNNNSKVTVKTK